MAISHSNTSLSSAQKRIWFDCQNGQTLQNHVVLAYELRGEFFASIMQQALTQLVAEHDIFRTTIFSAGKNLERMVHEIMKVDLKCLSLDANDDVYPTIQRLIEKPFNLSTGPLFRFTVLQKTPEESLLVLVFHRFIINTCALKKVMQEISRHYHAIFHQHASLIEQKLSYDLLVAHEKTYRDEPHYRETVRHWSHRIKDKQFHVDLTKLPESEDTLAHARAQRITLDETVHAQLHTFCSRFSCTPENFFLSVLQTLLYRYSDTPDIVINRPEEIIYQEAWQELIGPTGNILPWNVRIQSSMSFLDLLTQNQQFDTYKKYYANAHIADIVRAVRSRFNHHFDGFFSNVSFEKETIPYHAFTLPHVSVKALPQYIHRTRSEELQVFYDEHAERFYLSFDYSLNLSSRSVQNFVVHYENLLQEFLQDPKQKLSRVSFLPLSFDVYQERQSSVGATGSRPSPQLAKIGERTTKGDRRSPLRKIVPNLITSFENAVRQYPDHIALIDDNTSLTYTQLNQAANQLAHALKTKGIKTDDCVGLAMGRNVRMVIATLGILKAGAAYVPLDPSYPKERLAYMMQDAKISLVVTEKEFESFIQSCHPIKTLLLNKSLKTLQSFSTDNLPEKPALHDLAYVIYTSGSTGTPKGVLIEHRGLSNFACFQNHFFPVTSKSYCLQAASINFDITAFELYGPLIAGAKIYIANEEQRRLPQKLQEVIIERRINIILLTPSVLSHFEWKPMPDVKIIMSGAEACEQKLMDFWAHGRTFINGYGPTEITIGSHFKKYEPNTLFNNLGGVIPNVEAFVLDANLNPVPDGVLGELYIGGVGVARGYLNLPEQTKEKFIQSPLKNTLYRTNDIAYRLENGDFMYVGRNDTQIKIRGLRVELGEIEEKIKAYPDIERVLVRVLSHDTLGKLLVAYFIQDAFKKPIEENAFRDYLKSRLPEHMVPSYLIKISYFPMMRNGKIDYQALPSPFSSSEQFDHEQCSKIEQALIKIFAELFQMDEKALSLEHDFFALGGHSLLATQMIARIKQNLKLSLPVNKVFECRTIKKISEYLSTQLEHLSDELPLVHASKIKKIPLSMSQKQMWFFYQLDKQSVLYNIPFLIHFKQCNASTLIKSLYHLIDQNLSFRTIFEETLEEPVQKIVKKVTFDIPIYESLDLFYQQFEQWDKTPFDLMQFPLFRFAVCQNNDETLLYFNIHHIIFDGWSVKIFMQQLGKIYHAIQNNTKLPHFSSEYTYGDYAYSQSQWIKENKLDDQLEFWQSFLQGAEPTLNLPTDFPYPKQQNYQGNIIPINLPKTLVDELKALAIENKTTLFATLLTAYFILLYRYTKQSDIVIGAPIAGRYLPHLEPIIGFFVNESLYRQQLSNTKTFSELLQSVHQNACDAAENQAISFNQIIEALNIYSDPRHNPLFQVMFSLQTGHQLEGNFGDTLISYHITERHQKTAQLDITLLFNEMSSGDLEGMVEYRTDLFTETSMQHLCAHYVNVLQAIVVNPSVSIAELTILSYEEYQLLVNTWPYGEKKPLPTLTPLEMLENAVKNYSDLPALVFQEETLSYGAFWGKVEVLAETIKSHLHSLSFAELENISAECLPPLWGKVPTGGRGEWIVGILMPRGLEMIIAMCAIWKAGAAFLPLDADYPEERLRYMLEDSGTKIVVSVSELKEKQNSLGKNIAFVQADGAPVGASLVLARNNEQVQDLPRQNALSYIIYTSGSTGHPKGVLLDHLGLSNLITYMQDLYTLQPKMRVLQFASINFDTSMGEIFSALSTGACLYIADNAIRQSPEELQHYINKNKIELISLPPVVLESLEKTTMPSLKIIDFGGDTCDPSTIHYWKKHCRLINGYGPTEATVIASTKTYTSDDTFAQNIGRPLYNTEIFILDEDFNPVPTGVLGEICIGGIGLARGYLNREQLSLEKFTLHPFSDDPDARLYHTGDYGRWLPNGDIEFIGRMDNQVKIRGYRIEMGEIETLLNAYPGIKQTAVIARKEEQCLIAFFASDISVDIPALQLALQYQLPEYMMPSAFIKLDALPLNLSGKIDRKALQNKDYKDTNYIHALVEPTTKMEKQLAAIWKSLLKTEQIGIDNSFFELGGHSLLVTQMISRVKKSFKLILAITKVFELRTIRKLAEYLLTLQEEAKENLALQHTPEQNHGPLSYAQKQMWFFYQLNPDSAVYNISMLMRFENANRDYLLRALYHLIEQNVIFRTVIDNTGEEPVQVVLKKLDISIPVYDSFERFQRYMEQQDTKPFDLVNGPVFHLALAEEEKGTDICVYFNIHHIAFDGWSSNIFMDQLVSTYAALEKGKSLPSFITEYQYLDYAYSQHQWLEENRLADQLTFWQHFLQGAQTTLDLPTDFPYPQQQSFQGHVVKFILPSSLIHSLKSLATDNQTTLFAINLAAFFALLYRYTKQQDIIIGVPIAGRYQSALEPIIGFFVNESIYRQGLSNTQTFRELLKSVHQNACDAADNQVIPFNEILDKLNIPVDPKKNPLFQVLFNYQAIDPLADNDYGCSMRYRLEDRMQNGAKLDISLFITEMPDGSLQGGVEYRTDLFTELSMQHLCAHYQNLLQEIVINPDIPMVSYRILSEPEYQLLVNTWPYGKQKPLPEKTVLEMIEGIVRQYGDAPALVFEDKQLTYLAFWEKVEALAQVINSVKSSLLPPLIRGEIVGLLMPRGFEMIIAMCAVWKAGAAFLPLDADYPEERLHYMLEDSGAKIIISISELKEKQAIFAQKEVVFVQADDLPSVGATGGRPSPLQEDLAYIIYTSGSTGNPKGVMLEHVGLSNLVKCLHDTYKMKKGMRTLQLASINFDAAISEIFSTLSIGACLYIANNDLRRSPSKLQHYLKTKKIQLVAIAPALLEHFEKKSLPELKTIMVGGDTCESNVLNYWGKQCRLVNAYGPTETTVVSSAKIYTPDASSKNIGRPLYNMEMYILDEDFNAVPTGVMGEIFIGGIGLARGYLHRDDLTKERFIPHPFSNISNARLYRSGDYGRWLPNGEIEFIGRIDSQVKIRGYRIEMGEIETLLNAYLGIKQAVVIAKKEQQILVAYFSGKKEISSEQLAGYLAEKLPEYMIPAAFIHMDALPLNLSGKIDRKVLQAKDFRLLNQVRTFVEPTKTTEKILWLIWKEVLKTDQFGIDNSFFELGGHSLLVTQVISRVAKNLKLTLSIGKVFELRTIRKISEHLATLQEEVKENLALRHAPEFDRAPLSYAQKQMWFFYQLNPHSGAYNIPILMRFEQANQGYLLSALYHLIEENAIFRTVIDNTYEEPMQRVLKDFNITIPVYDALEKFQHDIKQWDEMPFDLIKGPVLRFALAQDGTDILVYFNVHHIAFDGWSTSIFMHQLVSTYAALEKNEPLPQFINEYQYLDYAYSQNYWLEENYLNDQLAFWQHFLQDAQTTLDLPTDFPYPPEQSFKGSVIGFALPSSLVHLLKFIATENQTTLFAVTLAAFFALLYRYTKQQDIIIGVPIAGRYQSALESLIGCFINEAIYRQGLSNTQTFRELLKSVHQNACDAADNQALPFNEILDKLNIPVDSKKNPLFQVLFNYQAVDPFADGGNEINGAGMRYHLEERSQGGAKLDITLSIAEMSDGSIRGGVEYRTDIFTELSIQHLCAHYQNLLQEIVSNSDVPMISYRILSEPEYQLLAKTWPYGEQRPAPEKTVLEMIEEAVGIYGDAPALMFRGKVLSYEEFWERVEALAQSIIVGANNHSPLQTQIDQPESIIGLLMPRGLEMIIAICAVWKIGAAFLPLDADYPEDRLHYMMEDSGAKVIISVSELKEKQAIFKQTDIMFIQADRVSVGAGLVPARDDGQVQDLPLQDRPAYLLYTSGSTGNPKGVLVGHRGLANLMPYLHDIYQLHPGMKVLQFTSINFDVSMGEIFPSLTSGACLDIVDAQTRRSTQHLQEYIETQKIDVISIPPAVLENFEKKPFSTLKTAIIIGDTCDIGTLQYWQKQCHLINGYGPTEATVIVSSKLMTQGIAPQNIGRPLYNTELFILDEDFHPVPTGVAGELLIGGMGLAHGYLYREDLTKERFVPHSFSDDPNARLYRTGDHARWLPNGEIEFIGRIDNQVKIRGYRIEIGEIETLLNAYPGIKQAVVIAKKEQQLLVAYFSQRENVVINAEILRAYLAEKLPEYMIPAAFIGLEALPVNLSGKIDRKILQAKDFRRMKRVKVLVEPRNELESQLWQIWTEVLKTDQISVEDSFFDLGGQSLTASRVSSRFQARYSMQCSVPLIFKCKTIAALAEALQSGTNSEIETNQQLMQADIQHAKKWLSSVSIKDKYYFPPRCILMTGAHGFLGAHLLQELLTETKASIICVVRANSQEELHRKVKRDLSRFNLASLAENPRVEWIIGDLSQPMLDLNKKDYERICEKVDSIYHSGAWVNHILTYESLRATNVESTLTFLKIASTHHPKVINYISTTSVALALEEMDHAGGYAQSKWVSEMILQEAEKHGFNIRIFRPGNISGHSKTGVCVAENNHALSMIKSCIQLSMAPNWTSPTEMLPVDILSQAIVRWSLQEKLPRNTWNLNNTYLLSWKDYIHYLNELGFNIKTVSLDQWKEALKTLDENNALFAFKDFYLDATLDNPSGTYVSQQGVLHEVDLEYPQDYQKLVNLYWTYLKKTGFILET